MQDENSNIPPWAQIGPWEEPNVTEAMYGAAAPTIRAIFATERKLYDMELKEHKENYKRELENLLLYWQGRPRHFTRADRARYHRIQTQTRTHDEELFELNKWAAELEAARKDPLCAQADALETQLADKRAQLAALSTRRDVYRQLLARR